MKKLSLILMTLVMVFTASCSKGSGEGEAKKDSTATAAKADVNAMKSNPNEANLVAGCNALVANIKKLAENDNQELFDQSVDLFLAINDGINKVGSSDVEKKCNEIMKAVDGDKYRAIVNQIARTAYDRKSGQNNNSYEDDNTGSDNSFDNGSEEMGMSSSDEPTGMEMPLEESSEADMM